MTDSTTTDGGDGPERPPHEPELSPIGAPATLPGTLPRLRGGRRRTKDGAPSEGGEPRRRLPKVGMGVGGLLILAVVVALAVVPALASGLKKTPRDKVGISYGGGPFEGSRYQRIVQPGSSLFFNGIYDPLYLYPADQQNYIVSKVVNQGSTAKSDSVVAPSSDRVQVSYQIAVYFKLNTDRLRPFHEQFGLKYNAYTTSGWNSLIQDTFRQQIENALQEQTRRNPVGDIYGNADNLLKVQNEVQRTLSQRLRLAMGSKFFCAPTFRPGRTCEDPTFVIKKVDIPVSVVTAFESNRTSQINIQTKTNEIAQREAEAKGIEALAAALENAGPDYVLLKAIESGKISFWVLPDNNGITIQGPGGANPGAPTPTSQPQPGR